MLHTIGYEGASLDDLISTLQLAGVEMLVDIRERAQSRRKGFSKTALSEALADAGIEYRHYRELGDPKEGREAARSGDWVRFSEVFGQVLRSDAAQAALGEIEETAAHYTICLLCYEREPKSCHRKIVSDELEARLDVSTKHLGVRSGEARRAA